MDTELNFQIGSYKNIKDKDFYNSINNKKEFYDAKITNRYKDIYCLEPQQRFLSNFINPLSRYNSVLIYHSVGVGKTLTAISIAENFKEQYKIVVLTKNNNIEANFRKELVGVCSGYFDSDEERNIFKDETHQDHADIKSKINRKINSHYIFSSYGAIKPNNNFNNSVVIIDEVHNITGNVYYDNIIKALRRSKRTKIILLSATPVYDNVKEIFEIANLLGNDLPIRGDLIKENYIQQNLKQSYLLSTAVNSITRKGESVIKNSFIGKVSFLSPDKSLFPERNNIGSPLTNKNNSIKVFRTILSSFQEEGYKKTFSIKNSGTEDENTLFKNSSDALTMIYPDGTYGKDGFVKNIYKNKNKSFLKKENIQKYSSKFYSILDNLEKANGSCFIYSNFVNYNGTDLIKEVLISNGYSYYTSYNKNPKYVLLDNTIKPKTKQKIIQLFNSKKNINGEIIKVLIGSPVISEGISFKNIRQIHILEPYWNLSRIEQVIGRGVRLNSHSGLPEDQRKVDIFLHTAVSSTEPETTSLDYLKYLMSEKKDREIKKIEYILKTIAIDCNLNKSRNMIKSKSKNGSRECQYRDCDYICEGNIKNNQKDYSTYNIENHDIDLYKFIIKHIKKLFTIGFVYDLDSIVNYIKNKTEKNIDIKNIYYVLDKILKKNIELVSPLGKKSFLISVGDYYILDKEQNPEDFVQYFNRIYSVKKNTYTLNEVLNIKETTSKKNKSVKNIEIINRDSPLLGTYLDKNGNKDNKFRIIDNRKVSRDIRTFSSGKVCLTFKKEELYNIALFMKLLNPGENFSKPKYCSLIEQKLIDTNNII